jgi:hypothetical protein
MKIVNRNSAVELIKLENSSFIGEIEFNHAHIIHLLNTKRYVVLPIDGNKSLIFDEKPELDTCVKNNYFPISNETSSIYEKINLISDSRYHVFSILRDSLNFNCTSNITLEELDSVLSKHTIDSNNENIIEAISFIVMNKFTEQFRDLKIGQKTIFTLNPFLKPILLKGEQEIYVEKTIVDCLQIFSRTDLNFVYNSIYADYMGFVPLTKQHSETLNRKNW